MLAPASASLGENHPGALLLWVSDCLALWPGRATFPLPTTMRSGPSSVLNVLSVLSTKHPHHIGQSRDQALIWQGLSRDSFLPVPDDWPTACLGWSPEGRGSIDK